MYLLGYDAGSSSIKASLLDAERGRCVASATSPDVELRIVAPQPGWAEQDPHTWWEHLCKATHQVLSASGVDTRDIAAIGLSYQMHGLVMVDEHMRVLRPSIIWCDGRAVGYGDKAFDEIGRDKCLERLLNSPGNFTASKLKWVKDNEPDIYEKAFKVMLPGDYLAARMTGSIRTTPSGLSEWIMWDYQNHGPADLVLDYYGISPEMLPEVVPAFSIQGELTDEAARELGLAPGTKLTYRGGDQPNNALSLNVLNPGEVATTAGTSGVVCGVTGAAVYDAHSRVNTFVHVNHTDDEPRYTVLLCVNGAGILYSWLKHNVMAESDAGSDTYERMNAMASGAPIGSDGLVMLPYGNGVERSLRNADIGASIHGLNFNIHGKAHLLRAAQEGIVFALHYGLSIMKPMGIEVETARAGYTNMFLSDLFAEAFATVNKAVVELYDTDGAEGAARGAGIGAGVYRNFEEAFAGLKIVRTIGPDADKAPEYQEAYERWLTKLGRFMG